MGDWEYASNADDDDNSYIYYNPNHNPYQEWTLADANNTHVYPNDLVTPHHSCPDICVPLKGAVKRAHDALMAAVNETHP